MEGFSPDDVSIIHMQKILSSYFFVDNEKNLWIIGAMNTQPIKDYMSKNGMRNYHMALKAGISPGLFHRGMKGETEFQLKTIVKIAKAMGITTATLVKRMGY